MASSSSHSQDGKREQKDVIGYVHGVSAVHMASTGTRYFDFKVQEEASKYTRVACFSPDKRDILKKKEESKEAVGLLNMSPQKRKFISGENEYAMGKYSKVVKGRSLSFPWKAMTRGTMTPTALLDISKGKNEIGDTVSVKAKVVSLSESESIYVQSMKKNLRKREAIVADASGVLHVCLWENLVDQVLDERSYFFTDLKVSFYKKMFLSCTKKTVISALEEELIVPNEIQEQVTKLKNEEEAVQTINGSIVSVEVSRLFMCINCQSRIHHEDVVNNAKSFLKCPGCNLTSLKSKLSSQMTASLVIEEYDGTRERYHCPSVVLESVFEDLNKTEGYNINEKKVTDMPEDFVVETLLLLGEVRFVIKKEEKLLKSINVGK